MRFFHGIAAVAFLVSGLLAGTTSASSITIDYGFGATYTTNNSGYTNYMISGLSSDVDVHADSSGYGNRIMGGPERNTRTSSQSSAFTSPPTSTPP